ncbi:hypothetical protein SLEP1_g47997 [Rubroshorea leprosula]|uniref:DUF4220 domain-containing protein n=1 Tax=Rubroshorea leprosula TaxID=152421 RepID=A0AAV5LUA0_9ROSI|nr:hypothetical protein SLEP1_g47997 [Rubroshorea leprosula]
MLLPVANHVQRLWDSWHIRGLIILSLLLQSFLVLFAPLRKQRGGKWIIMIPLWIAYLLADWVATFTIGLMLRAEGSDILALWAPFLLLHLGGPDTITSFSLEDNEFWIRHLLELILQVGATLYVILHSLPGNKLWLPTFLVLIAGVIKYAERNRAFYLASFDHFGNNWAYRSINKVFDMPPIPVQFEQLFKSRVLAELKENIIGRPPLFSKPCLAASTVGAIKSLLVGPPLTKRERSFFCFSIPSRGAHEMLRIIEIQLSLLYELLHTKLPVVDSKIGYIFRTVNFGCILGALVSFSILLKKYYHYKLREFDICLTYGLLTGALVLDLISIWLLTFSDWIICTENDDEPNKRLRWSNIRRRRGSNLVLQLTEDPCRENDDEFIKRRRWSNLVPQLNILDYHFKNKDGDYPNKLVDFLGTCSLFETIRRRIQYVSLENFVEEQAWKLIFTTLCEQDIGEAGMEIFGPSRILTRHITNFAWTLDRFEHMESLLIWHIATEICYQKGCPDNSTSSSASTSTNCFDHRKICKLISDYMFYLLVMEPTMTATSPNNLKIIFEVKDGKWEWPSYWKKGSKGTLIFDLEKLLEQEPTYAHIEDILKKDVDELGSNEKDDIASFSRIYLACFLAMKLLKYEPGGCPWNLMSRFWVEILCYAAIHSQPIVHARQVSKGGQLLTLVWLLINYLGINSSSKGFVTAMVGSYERRDD